MLIAPTLENVPPGIVKPPLGLAYIAAMLEKKNHTVKIIDMYSFGLGIDKVITEIEKFKPRLIGFSVLTPYMNAVSRYSSQIKKKFKNVKIVIGGAHPSALPERCLKEAPAVDYVVVGEGEIVMLELVEALEHNKCNIKKINGLAYRVGKEIKFNHNLNLIENIDSIPFPAWHLLDMESYMTSLSGDRTFHIITTRGCPGRCLFCDSHRIWQRRVRFRSVNNIIEELKQLKEKYRMQAFVIQDDTFTLNHPRMEEFCNSLVQSGLDLKWECKGRIASVNPHMLELMSKAGCQFIAYGGESGSDEILKFIKKGITVEQIRNAVKWTKEAGIKVGMFWMMGFPPEKEEHIHLTFKLARELDTTYCSDMMILVPYPGTDLYPVMKKEGLVISEDWEKYFKTYEHFPDREILPPIRTKYLTAQELLKLSKKYNGKLRKIKKLKLIMSQIPRVFILLIHFLKEPKSFTKRAFFFLKKLI